MRADGVPEKSPVDTLYWMRESELKHGRIAQLAGELPMSIRLYRYRVDGSNMDEKLEQIGVLRDTHDDVIRS